MENGIAEVYAGDFYYELAGAGQDLILLHAGIADRRMWGGQFEAFAESRRVLRYDRRGFGGTRITSDAFSHDADLAGLMRELGIGRAALVGCSQGAKIALDFALTRPELVASLVLVAPAVSGYEHEAELPPQVEELQKAEAAGDVERVNELELQIWVDGPRRAPGEVDPAVRELARQMNLVALASGAETSGEQSPHVGAAGRLGEVRVPTLVVVGDLDTPATLEAAEFLAGGIRGARLEVIRGAAHLPNMERPEEFNRLVLEFLGGIAGDGVRV